MGWTFPYGASKKDVIRELVEGHGHNSFGEYQKDAQGNEVRDAEGKLVWIPTATGKVLAHCLKGNVLWIVRAKYLEGMEVDRWIECNLLMSDMGEWGYKDMEESSGPNECSCPLKYLDMVPCPYRGYAKAWRERVKAYWAERNAIALRHGLKLKVKPGWHIKDGTPIETIEVVKDGRRWRCRINGMANLFRFPRRMLIGCEPA